MPTINFANIQKALNEFPSEEVFDFLNKVEKSVVTLKLFADYGKWLDFPLHKDTSAWDNACIHSIRALEALLESGVEISLEEGQYIHDPEGEHICIIDINGTKVKNITEEPQ